MTDIDDNIFVINDTEDGNDTNGLEQGEEQLFNDGVNEVSEAATTSNAIDVQDMTASNITDRDKDKDEIDDDDAEGLIPLCVRHTAGPKLSTAAFGYDIAIMNKKPWRNPAANLNDYFNYGFNEKSWRLYCAMQEKGSESVLSKANEMLSMLESKRHVDNVAATSNNDYYHNYYQGRDGKSTMQANNMFTAAHQEQRLYSDRSIPPPLGPPPQFSTQNTFPYTHSGTPQPPQSSDDNKNQSSKDQNTYTQINHAEEQTSLNNKNNANTDHYSLVNDYNLHVSSKAEPSKGSEPESMYLTRSNPLAPPNTSTERPYSYERELPSQHMPQYASNYKTKLCQRFMDGHCTRGSECNYAHGVAELRSFAPRPMPQSSFPINYFSSSMPAQPSSSLPLNTMMPNYEMYDQRYMPYPSTTPTQRFVAPPTLPPPQQQTYVANTSNMQGTQINNNTTTTSNSSDNNNDNASNEAGYIES